MNIEEIKQLIQDCEEKMDELDLSDINDNDVEKHQTEYQNMIDNIIEKSVNENLEQDQILDLLKNDMGKFISGLIIEVIAKFFNEYRQIR